jgi:hypothetical protein
LPGLEDGRGLLQDLRGEASRRGRHCRKRGRNGFDKDGPPKGGGTATRSSFNVGTGPPDTLTRQFSVQFSSQRPQTRNGLKPLPFTKGKSAERGKSFVFMGRTLTLMGKYFPCYLSGLKAGQLRHRPIAKRSAIGSWRADPIRCQPISFPGRRGGGEPSWRDYRSQLRSLSEGESNPSANSRECFDPRYVPSTNAKNSNRPPGPAPRGTFR